MRRTKGIQVFAAGLAALLLASVPATAQDLFSATYDGARTIRLKGVATGIDWVNPHAFLYLNVKDNAGTVARWAVEIGNPIELERSGWKPTAVKVGDEVTVDGLLARDPVRQAFAKSVTAKAGTKLFVVAARKPAAAAAPAPRWPDGQVRLGPEPGKKGYWGKASASSLVEKGAAIPMNEEGLLKNILDADRVAPFQPWAKALYELRQRTMLKDDPAVRCLPAGGPRQFQMANGFQFVEQKELGRILVLLGGGDRNWRAIYTDGRPQGEPAEVVRGFFGNSVGHWEKDTLVVDSIGYNEKFWLANGGLPSTEGLHLVERFTRSDFNTLKYEVTVDDPRTYTRPWTGGWTVQWVPGEEIQEYFCEENAEQTFVR